MSLNFLNRIFTSIILLILLLIGLLLNNFFWLYLLIISSMISYYEFSNMIKKRFKKKNNIIYLYNIITFIYLCFFIFTGYKLNNSSSISLIFILSICIFSDTGGYIVGKTIGGKKLTKISPNKTVSGSVGSFFFSLFPIIIFNLIESLKYSNQDITILIFVSLFLSLICQSGDLLISYFKRQSKVKDTGFLLPGHGGLLDRIDGIIFVIPVAYFIERLIF